MQLGALALGRPSAQYAGNSRSVASGKRSFRVAAQHSKGRLTARERVALLVEPGRFVEHGQLAHSDRAEVGEEAAADALVTGVGLVDGRKVAVMAVDSTVMVGTTGWEPSAAFSAMRPRRRLWRRLGVTHFFL